MVANQEYLNLDCATVDVAPGADAAEVAGALAAEVRHPSVTSSSPTAKDPA
ncbi:hypothetical protein GCM10020219_099370 [Nonomuraea dietziae]